MTEYTRVTAPKKVLENGTHREKMRMLSEFTDTLLCGIHHTDTTFKVLLSLYSMRDNKEEFTNFCNKDFVYINMVLSIEKFFGSGFNIHINDGVIDLYGLLRENIPNIIDMMKPIVYEYLQTYYIPTNDIEKFVKFLELLPYENKKYIMDFIIDRKPEWNVYLIQSIADSPDKPGDMKL